MSESEIDALYVAFVLITPNAADTHVWCVSRHRHFINRHPSGTLNRAEFFRHYGSNHTQDVSDRLFDLIDTNKNGTIDVEEWVVAKSIIEAGDLEQKLKCGLLTCVTIIEVV
jgi:hypothetical protein